MIDRYRTIYHTWLSVDRSLFGRWWKVCVNTQLRDHGISTTVAKFRNQHDAEEWMTQQKQLRGFS